MQLVDLPHAYEQQERADRQQLRTVSRKDCYSLPQAENEVQHDAQTGNDGGPGSSAYGDFAQKRWFDGIDSFHQYRTPVGVPHYGSAYERSDNHRNAESTQMDPIGEGFKAFLDLGH